MPERYRPEPREQANRSERMADAIRQATSIILERDVNDPRIGFVTVTSVRLTPDLRTARIFVSVLGDDKKKEAAKDGLIAATKFVRFQIAHQLRLKYTPTIEFELDRSDEIGDRIDELIRKSHGKR
jgi:ribosome-binding factor A